MIRQRHRPRIIRIRSRIVEMGFKNLGYLVFLKLILGFYV